MCKNPATKAEPNILQKNKKKEIKKYDYSDSLLESSVSVAVAVSSLLCSAVSVCPNCGASKGWAVGIVSSTIDDAFMVSIKGSITFSRVVSTGVDSAMTSKSCSGTLTSVSGSASEMSSVDAISSASTAGSSIGAAASMVMAGSCGAGSATSGSCGAISIVGSFIIWTSGSGEAIRATSAGAISTAGVSTGATSTAGTSITGAVSTGMFSS